MGDPIALIAGTIGWNWLAYKLWARSRKSELPVGLAAIAFLILCLTGTIASWSLYFSMHASDMDTSLASALFIPVWGVLLFPVLIELGGIAFAVRTINSLDGKEDPVSRGLLIAFALVNFVASWAMMAIHIRSGHFFPRFHM